MADWANDLDLAAVPLFPLPDVVLLPTAVLPLHIFEDRYKEMVADALDSDRLIAMALLRPGWMEHYYGYAEIEPVVCVGHIVSHERFDNGCYNLLLQGIGRARIVREMRDRAYRRAHLVPLTESSIPPSDQIALRQRLMRVFTAGPLGQSPLAGAFARVLDSELHIVQVADLIAFNFIEDIPLKQSLLAEQDASLRITQLITALNAISPASPPDISHHTPSLN